MEIHGEKIILKLIKSEEKKEFRQLVTNSYGSKFWYGDEGDKRTEKEFFKYWHDGFFTQNDLSSGKCFWIIVKDIKIGAINYNKIDKDDKKVELDILIGDKENYGKGYGSDSIKTLAYYLFKSFDINKIWVEVRAFNTASIKVFEKVGFKQEGLLKEENYFNNQFIDCIRLGLLKNDFIS